MREGEIKRTIGKIPEEVKNKCLELLTKEIGNHEAASLLEVDTSEIKSWLKRREISKEKNTEVVLLAIKKSAQAKELISEIKKAFDLLARGLEQVDKKENLEKLLRELSSKSKIIVAYCWRNQYARIQELSEIISAPNDMYTLELIRNRINKKSRHILGKKILKFKQSELDELSQERVSYAWWFNLDLPEGSRVRKRVSLEELE